MGKKFTFKDFKRTISIYADVNNFDLRELRILLNKENDSSYYYSFKELFEEAINGHLSRDEYERLTRNDFDTDEEYHKHLKEVL
jgi:hypothetical protein